MLVKATDETPGSAAIFSRMLCCMRSTCAGSFTCASGMKMRSVCTSSGRVNPGCTLRSVWNVRIIRPEPINNSMRETHLYHYQRVPDAMPLPALALRASPGA